MSYRRRGFTFIELLASSFLLSILLSFLFYIFFSSFDRWEKNYENTELNSDMNYLWELLAMDFEQIQTIRSQNDFSVFYNSTKFYLEESKGHLILAFYTKDYYSKSEGTLSLVTYYLSKTDLNGDGCDNYSLFRCAIEPGKVFEMDDGIETLLDWSLSNLLSFSGSTYSETYILGNISSLELKSLVSEVGLFKETLDNCCFHYVRDWGLWELLWTIEVYPGILARDPILFRRSFRKELNSL